MCVCTRVIVCLLSYVCVCVRVSFTHCHVQLSCISLTFLCVRQSSLCSFQSSLLQFCPVIHLSMSFPSLIRRPYLFLFTCDLSLFTSCPFFFHPFPTHPLFILCLFCSLLLLLLFLSLCHPHVVSPLALLSTSPSFFPLIFLSLLWLSSPSLINLHPPSCLSYSMPFILQSLISLLFFPLYHYTFIYYP